MGVIEDVKERSKQLKSYEQMLGKGLYMPNNPTNAGQRSLMWSTMMEQTILCSNPEVPLLGTGYEPRYGESSSSFVKAKHDMKVLAKINKFSFAPNHHYFLIVQDLTTGMYDVIERAMATYSTESYGYLNNNDKLDSYHVDSIIEQNSVIKKSNAFDELNNRMDWVNLITTYMANELTKEDANIISESAAKRMKAPFVKKGAFIINDNDIPLNMYGDNEVYKIFPNIGEETINGILMALRREKNDNALFSQSIDRLQTLMINDDVISLNGKVIDINVYCNNKELIATNPYFKQIKFYDDEKTRFESELVTVVAPFDKTKCSYQLNKLYDTCIQSLDGKQYLKDKPFSNVMIEFTLIEERNLEEGDKICNRFGGKGIISKVIPDELMPKIIIDGEEKPVDVIFNFGTCFNRENLGQLFESSINNIAQYIVSRINLGVYDEDEIIELLKSFYKIVAPDQEKCIFNFLENSDECVKKMFIDSIISDGGINVSELPMTEVMDLDKIEQLYNVLPFKIYQSKFMVPQKDSMGNTRFIEARRPIIAAPQYIRRLKQYGEEKFSAVSLSSTNVRNENSRNNSKKTHKSIHSKTPVKFFGEMETNDLIHIGAENIVKNLMLYSASPHGRLLAESLLTDNPYDINIELDTKAKNRSVEKLNAYLTTMGLELKFEKVPKNIKHAYLRKGYKRIQPKELIQPFRRFDPSINPSDNYVDRVMEEYKKYGLNGRPFKRIPFRRIKK